MPNQIERVMLAHLDGKRNVRLRIAARAFEGVRNLHFEAISANRFKESTTNALPKVS